MGIVNLSVVRDFTICKAYETILTSRLQLTLENEDNITCINLHRNYR